jgi:ABC-2 type transport system permease protein
MRIISIIIKEILQMLRDKKGMAIMIAFPILLIMILGAAFSNVFSSDNSVPFRAEVLYKNESGEGLTSAFNSFKETIKEAGVNLIEEKNVEEAKASIQSTGYACYIILSDDSIKIYKNDRYDLHANYVEAIFNGFVQRYNAISEIGRTRPLMLEKILSEVQRESVIQKVTLDAKKSPRAVDYYTVTMITLIILYGSMTGSYGISGERTRGTGRRILAAPLGKGEYLFGKTLGAVLVTILQILIVVLVSKYIIKAYWGDNLPLVFAVLISLIVLAISLGVGISYMVKKESTASSILNTLIPFLVFLGGGYTPLDQIGNSLILKLAEISPIRWANRTIFNVIYNSDTSQVLQTIALNLAVAAVFIGISSYIFKKEVA